MVEQTGQGNQNQNSIQTNKKTPKWLKALEAQSWQAELIISGLVVAGLAKLPDLLTSWGELQIINSSQMGAMFWNLFFLIIFSGTFCLLLCFCIHFLFRSIWIALLGLNSVYPNGINVNSKAGAGKKYWENAKSKYPDLSTYNQELDHKCSLIFSIGSNILIMLSSIAVWVLLIYFIFNQLVNFFPSLANYVIHIGIGFYVIFTMLSLAAQYLPKKYPENKTIEKLTLKLGSGMTSIFSLYIFDKPINYITGILTSNIKSKLFIVSSVIIGFLMGIASSAQTGDNPIFNNFTSDKYFTFNNKPYKSLSYNYENLRPEHLRVFSPTIQSDVISDSFLKIFIPHIEQEKESIGLKKLSILQKLKASRHERNLVEEDNLLHYIKFNKIFINNTSYPIEHIQYFKHPNANEEGLLVYLPIEGIKEGINILEIRKNYYSKDNVQKIVSIPFYFESN